MTGSGPLFQLADNELELGLGIHGEAGIKRIEVLFQFLLSNKLKLKLLEILLTFKYLNFRLVTPVDDTSIGNYDENARPDDGRGIFLFAGSSIRIDCGHHRQQSRRSGRYGDVHRSS